jgi:hypothetical protein
MRCTDCGRERDPGERGWVIVLSPRDEPRILYCAECMRKLLGHAPAETDDADGGCVRP